MVVERRAWLGVLLGMCIGLAAHAEIFKYTDAFGNVTFSNKPLKETYYKLEWKTKRYRDTPRVIVDYKAYRRNRKRFAPLIAETAKRHGVSAALLHAVVRAESAYDPTATSKVGAVGLMQLMPDTARGLKVRDRKNPRQNLDGGARYLKELIAVFKDDLRLALAAYNAGPGAVRRYGNKVPPYKETRQYVKKVMAFMKEYRKAGRIDS